MRIVGFINEKCAKEKQEWYNKKGKFKGGNNLCQHHIMPQTQAISPKRS